MWQAFVQWFADAIHYLYGITELMGVPNYGLAIIFMTIIIKLIMFPLTQKQMRSMRGMQELQPKMKYIQEKYKDDPQLMQTKIMGMYKEHGVNPFGGCLPLIVQMPIFIALFQSLYRFEFRDMAHAGFLWVPNIGNPDPYYLLAVLAAGTTYLQQRLAMVDTKDPTQRIMLYMMPVFMAWIAATFPAGLPLYWVTFNFLGILQQLYVNWGLKKEKMDTGKGIEVPVEVIGTEPDQDIEKASKKEDDVALRDKGGKNDGSPDNRKKRKKRR